MFSVVMLLTFTPPPGAAAGSAETPIRKQGPAPGEGISVMFAACTKAQLPGLQDDCTCYEPLHCGAAGCATYDDDLREITKLLKAKPKKPSDLTLGCSYVEVGTCGDYRYIYCDMGQPGYFLRFFDKSGRLRAARLLSDDPEYCDQQARVEYQGLVPDCSRMHRTKALYGKGESPRPPVEK